MRYFVEDAAVTGELLLVTVEPDDPDAPVLSLGSDGRWVEDPRIRRGVEPSRP